MSLHGVKARRRKLEQRYTVDTERGKFTIVYPDGTVSESPAPKGAKESLTVTIDYGDGEEGEECHSSC